MCFWEHLGASGELRGASEKLRGSFSEVSGRLLKGSGSSWELLWSFWVAFREASGKLLGSFWEASGQLPGSFWEASGKLLEAFWEAFASLWEVSGKFLGGFLELVGAVGLGIFTFKSFCSRLYLLNICGTSCVKKFQNIYFSL